MLGAISNLMEQMQILERDYNDLQRRFVDLQKCSRFFESQITKERALNFYEGHFCFEIQAWPNEKLQMEKEVDSLRKLLLILCKQSRYQNEQLDLSRREVNVLIRSQSAGFVENERLLNLWNSDQQKTALEMVSSLPRKETQHLENCVVKILRARLVEKNLSYFEGLAKLRFFCCWARVVRERKRKQDLNKRACILAVQMQRRLGTNLFVRMRAWFTWVLMRRRKIRTIRDRCIREISAPISTF